MSINQLEDEMLKGELLEHLKKGGSLTTLLSILALAATGRVDDELNKEEINLAWEVDEATFKMSTEGALHALRAMGIDHNNRVGHLNSLLTKAENLEDVPGIRVYYYFNRERDDFIVQSERSKLGIIPTELKVEEVASSSEAAEGDTEDGIEIIEVIYEPIDRTDFLIERAEILKYLTSISLRITEQILTLESMKKEIDDSEDIPGARNIYYYDPEQHNFGYVTKRKNQMGFFVPVPKEKPTTEDTE